jgi:ribonuclease D
LAAIITTAEALSEWLARLSEPVALDTEGDSLHCYFEKLCLIQVSTPGEDVLVDPLASLDFQEFNETLRRKTLVLHGCDYDLRMLRRGTGFMPGRVYDTYLAARLIGLKEVGLAALVKNFFGLDLPKSSQKANWALRPLSATMIEYAVNDTRYLIELVAKLETELYRLNRKEWFEQSVERAVAAAAEDREKDPERQWMIGGSAVLKGLSLAILRALWFWRDAEARQIDRPAFHILKNEELLELARSSVNGSFKMPHYMPSSRRKRLDQVLEKALQIPESEWPQRVRISKGRFTFEQEKQFDDLKKHRDHVAEELQLDPGILAPRQTLERIIREPESVSEVLMPWQRELLLSGNP